MPGPYAVESLLSSRLFLSPQLVGDRIYFLSDLSGRISLYAMDRGGSVPEPLLPRDVALQNPALMEGALFVVFSRLGQILVMIDRDGDENYQPCWVPVDGGTPEPAFGDRFAGQQVELVDYDLERCLAFLTVDPRVSPLYQSYRVDLESLDLIDLGTSLYGNFAAGANEDGSKVVLIDMLTPGDHVAYLWEAGRAGRRLLHGKPLDERAEGEPVPLSSFNYCHFTDQDKGLLFFTSLFDDRYGLGYLSLEDGAEPRPVEVVGTVHSGAGELYRVKHLHGTRYLLIYNIDGCSWAYEGVFDEDALRFEVSAVTCGQGSLANGVLQAISYDKASGDYVLSFSTATSPTQLYTVEGPGDRVVAHKIVRHTRERILGIPADLLAPGEDASYDSHDGLRISARLYLPAEGLGYSGKRPVVFYIHGGPQSQERPDFAWFSMALIQSLTLRGMAVFVPNVRGSTGYGLDYMVRVDRDWGGQDRLDHVEAFQILAQDERLDMGRVGVTGRSYGGYMTLMLAGRHPELWQAACDMFGPYNLTTFVERLPETWKTYFYLAIGHPERDRDALIAQSPRTYLHRLACPLLVIQGANDPRVREAESRQVVDELRAAGKDVEYLVFENEGHDVIKFENKVTCFKAIVGFFERYLRPGEPGELA